jgi:hypothetical protein
MRFQNVLHLFKSALRYIPVIQKIKPQKTGGTIESRYCYSIWMRHLQKWSSINVELPKIIAELGPGDSLGTGFAALLSGCECIYALDIARFWNVERNLKVFEELVDIFEHREAIPDNKEYPSIKPEIENYDFPNRILTDALLKISLSKERLTMIRKEIMDIGNPQNTFIKCKIPWYQANTCESESVDFIYSQAVLEYVDDLKSTYKAMRDLLKPAGIMSHTIDFNSYVSKKIWNEYWTYGDYAWKIIKGAKSFTVNRQPFSCHLELHSKYKFKILQKVTWTMNNYLSKKEVARRFKNLTNEELTTSGLYVLSQKINNKYIQ